MDKRISIIGLGYIGLPTAALLASRGYKVKGIDINQDVVEAINNGLVLIKEPGLDALVKSTIKDGSLEAFNSIQEGDIYIICVPTPFNEDIDIATPDLSFVEEATRSLSSILKKGDMVILESTSPIGTSSRVKKILEENGVNTEGISIAYCPERVIPGNVLEELVLNDRVVGGINESSTINVREFYKTFVKGNILETNSKTAEMCKLVENSYRDVNIAFANELSMICDDNDINVWDLIDIANHHPRVNILKPGTGVGGHCIAVDPWFIISENLEKSVLMKTSREVNKNKTKWVVNQIINKARELNIDNIICLGLAFKPNIDDTRESPAIEVVTQLREQGFDVTCVEPNLESHEEFTLIGLKEAINNFNFFVLLVDHKEFQVLDSSNEIMNKTVLDFCGTLNSK
tara:strand:+ start:1686 stop:2894 length:1209 start_codon:yes stop_codon:yes gene_type:complete